MQFTSRAGANRRDSKDFSFIELNDGSSLRNLQIIAKSTLPNYAALQRLTTGASVSVRGSLVASQGKGQKWELAAEKIDIVGTADDSYPLQKKSHTPEFLREIAHLRPRSESFLAVSFGCGADSHSPFTSSFRNAVRLRPYADHHRKRLRRCGRIVSRLTVDSLPAQKPRGEIDLATLRPRRFLHRSL